LELTAVFSFKKCIIMSKEQQVSPIITNQNQVGLFSLSLQAKDQSDSEGSSPLTVTSRVCSSCYYFLFIFNWVRSFSGIQKVSNFFDDDFRFCVCWEISLLDRLLCSLNGFNQFGNELQIIVPLDSLALLPLSPFGLFLTIYFYSLISSCFHFHSAF
jgi:hypothetical protein